MRPSPINVHALFIGAPAGGPCDGAKRRHGKHESVCHEYAPTRDAGSLVPGDVRPALETARLAALLLPESGRGGGCYPC